MSLPYEAFIALRYLGAKRKQTFVSVISLISILGICVGTAALVIALALMTGFEQDIRERIFRGNAHINIHRLRGGRDIGEVDEVLRRISAVSGVISAAPVAEGFGLLSGGASGAAEKALFLGVDPAREAGVTSIGSSMVSGSFDRLAERGEERQVPAVLGAELAVSLGVDTGDTVQAMLVSARLTPWGALPKTAWLRVVGIFDAGFFEYNTVRCYLPIDDACRLFNVDGASWIAVRVEGISQIRQVEERIQEALGDDFYVANMLDQNQPLLSALKIEKLLMFIAISLIVMVAALNIVSTLVLLVMEKVRDIGSLVAMGATSRGVMLLFLLQGLVIGLVGTISGVTIGSVVSRVLDTYRVIRLNPDVYYIAHVPFRAEPMDALGVALLAVTISLLATVYPSWKASRLDPVEALRHE
jgi:lipoprotein-releasing system permease protein